MASRFRGGRCGSLQSRCRMEFYTLSVSWTADTMGGFNSRSGSHCLIVDRMAATYASTAMSSAGARTFNRSGRFYRRFDMGRHSQIDPVAGVPRHGYLVSVIRTLFLAVLSLAPGACDDACTNEVIIRLASPDSKREAVMFQRDCGATSGYSTQISIVEVGQAPVGGGNTFRADDNHGAAKVGEWGGSWAEIKWLASDRLLVRHADKSRIFEQDNSVAGVSVSYETVAM